METLWAKFMETISSREMDRKKQNVDFLRICLVWLLTVGVSVSGENPCASGGSARCVTEEERTQLTCSEGIHSPHSRGSLTVTTLTLCRWPEFTFDPARVLTMFPRLRRLSVADSNITSFVSNFTGADFLQVVNMSSLNLQGVSDYTFYGLQLLEYIDLRNNSISYLREEAFVALPNLKAIYLSGNKFNCTREMKWVINEKSYISSRVHNKSTLLCHEKYKGKPIVLIMDLVKRLDESCPKGPKDFCNCIMDHAVWSNNYLVPVITVDCSYRSFHKFPDRLPENTTTLLLQGNKISRLEPLVNNPHYSRVLDVILDNNIITSLDILEGANWLFTFRVLSLRDNYLTDLPTYVLDNALKKNQNLEKLFLGHNPWRCDCRFTPDFKELILKYQKAIKDVDDIRCALVDGDDNSLMIIQQLQRTSLCKEPDEYFLDGLDILNIVLASLILLIVGNLLYDYLTFKKTGKVPWIVTKMP